MHVLVRKLRVDGVRLPQPGEAVSGVLEIERGKPLRLRATMAAPGHATLAEIWRPELAGVFGNTFVVRGIEQGSRGGAVIGEWQVEVAR